MNYHEITEAGLVDMSLPLNTLKKLTHIGMERVSQMDMFAVVSINLMFWHLTQSVEQKWA